MPIITPAYPSMCATHNITSSTKHILTKELHRGGDLVDKIFTKQMQWKDLFDRHTFFTKDYKYYLSIVSTSRDKITQALWAGLVESRLRLLVSDLQADPLIKIAPPFCHGFKREHRCQNEEEVDAVIRGELKYQAIDVKTETVEESKDPIHAVAAEGGADNISVADGANEKKANGSTITMYTTTFYIGLELAPGMYHFIPTAPYLFFQMPKNWTSRGALIISEPHAKIGRITIPTSTSYM